MTAKAVATILVVEDNPADQLLFREGAKLSSYPASLYFAGNGNEALSFLRRKTGFTESPRPDVILLDLNLPGKDGREVLAELKREPALADIPVMIFSTSSSTEDIARAYDLGATSYLTKPSDLNEYLDLVQGVIATCFRMVEERGAN